MKIHYDGGQSPDVTYHKWTICGFYWNWFIHPDTLVTRRKKKVTCKTCIKLLKGKELEVE